MYILFALLASCGDVSASKNVEERKRPSVLTNQVREFLKSAFQADLEEVKKYVVAGGDVNAIDEHGRSAFYQACSSSAAGVKRMEVLKFLRENGADVNKADKNMQTPLVAMIKIYSVIGYVNPMIDQTEAERLDNERKMISEMIKFLVKDFGNSKKVDLNARNREGDTALMISVKKQLINLVELLVLSGADLSIKNNAGEDAVALANQIDNGNNDLKGFIVTGNKEKILGLLQASDL